MPDSPARRAFTPASIRRDRFCDERLNADARLGRLLAQAAVDGAA
jgi:hypothetical protein